jgi:multidrug efflux system membrane fusion protein
MSVEALDRDQTQKLAMGSLLTLDNQIDTTTGTLKLKAIFQNGDLALFPNQFVNARLLVDTQQNATLIPVAAIQRNAKGAFVYVIKPDSTAGLQNITVGTTDGSISAVQGISAGTEIATTGFDKLQDGAKVTVRNNPPNGQNGQNGSNNNNNGQSQSSPNSTRGAAPGTSPSDSATPNNGTSSTGNKP